MIIYQNAMNRQEELYSKIFEKVRLFSVKAGNHVFSALMICANYWITVVAFAERHF